MLSFAVPRYTVYRGIFHGLYHERNFENHPSLPGVQTVGRKTSWAKDIWANYFLGDRRLGDNSHFKKDVSPKDGWATKA